MDDLLQQGIIAHKAGKRDEARKYFIAAIKQDRDNERAWQYMYNLANDDKERLSCLVQILRINPQNEKATMLLNKLKSPESHLQTPINTPQINNTQPQTPLLKKCPYCAEEIQRDAIVCKHCGRDLNSPNQPTSTASKQALIPAWRQGLKVGFVMAILSGCYVFVRYSSSDPALLIGSLVIDPIASFIGWTIVGTIIVWLWRQISGR